MDELRSDDPRWIGSYRLLGRLGTGGMGRVYLARSERGRTVAVKLVRAELAEQEEFRSRFRREVHAARRVGGRWTAPVLDADTEAAVPWVATGYVAGPSLQQVVARDHGPLPESSVRVLASGLAHALADIHAAGLVHRDLKPSNVLVTIDGPRVIDFGIARALETVADGAGGAGGDGTLTSTGAMVGSPAFMSPEQVRGDRVTPACDIFCLGSVLAYAATGLQPFGAASSGVHAQMFRIVQEPPDLDAVPDGLRDLVAACLAKDPRERPSLPEVQERLAAGAPGGLAGPGGGQASAEPWLPGAIVAQLGRQAVRLLELEAAETGSLPVVNPADAAAATRVRGAAAHPPAAPSEPATGAPAAPTTPSAPTAFATGATPAEPSTPLAPGAPTGPTAFTTGGRPGGTPAGASGFASAAAPATPGPASPAAPSTAPPAGGTGAGPASGPGSASGVGGLASGTGPASAAGYGAGGGPVAPAWPQAGAGGGTYAEAPGGMYAAAGAGGAAPASAEPPLPPRGPHTPTGGPGQPGAPGALGHGPAVPPTGHGAGGPGPAPARRGRRGVLVAAVLVVAAVAGATTALVALRSGDHGSGHPHAGSGATAPTTKAGAPAGRTPAPTGTVTAAPGAVLAPADLVGTWHASFSSGGNGGQDGGGQSDENDRTLTIHPDGSVELTGDGGSYSCAWSMHVTSAGPPATLSPSRVVRVEPAGSCLPGEQTSLTLLDPTHLRRDNADPGKAPLTYEKVG